MSSRPPFWLGLHEGGFDLYDRGEAPSVAFDRFDEDGPTKPRSDEFNALRPSGIQTTLGSAPIAPGTSLSVTLDLDPTANRYLTYASMVVPSNDAFVAHGNPLARPFFDGAGSLTPISFKVFGAEILDPDTEANTELDAAFINQTGPNIGVCEVDTVEFQPAFVGAFAEPGDGGLIFGRTNALGGLIDPLAADFTLIGYELAQVVMTPLPRTAFLRLPGFASFGLIERARRR